MRGQSANRGPCWGGSSQRPGKGGDWSRAEAGKGVAEAQGGQGGGEEGEGGRGRRGGGHLARLLVHVEGADDALGDLAAGALYQVLGQAVGQVGLAGATGAGEDKAPVDRKSTRLNSSH